MRLKAWFVLVVALLGATGLPRAAYAGPSPSPSPSAAPGPYSDVPADAWYTPAVKFVAKTNDWMVASGNKFRPAALVTRLEFARALVLAYAPSVQPDPSISFSDLPKTDPSYRFANVAVELHWLYPTNDAFVPAGAVNRRILDRGVVLGLGLTKEVRGLRGISEADGTKLAHASDFPYLILGSALRLHYNHSSPDDPQDLGPRTNATRADVAYTFYSAHNAQSSWLMDQAKSFTTVTLPNLTAAQKQGVEFALKWAGYPYVYGGDWYKPTNSSYCCGTQNAGGFDCSGWAWWVLKSPANGYDDSKIRGYRGWSLPQRTSYDMARYTSTKIAYKNARPLDILMFDTDSSTKDGTSWQSIDHVGIYLGNGWMIHSSGSPAGVVLEQVYSWWQSHLRWARRIVS